MASSFYLKTTDYLKENSIYAQIKNFTIDREAKSSTPRTIHYYVSELNLFGKWLSSSKGLDNPPIEAISSSILKEYFISLASRRNRGGVHCSYRVIRAFFNWYWEEYEPDQKNPISKVKIENPKNHPLPEIPIADIRKLLDATYGKTQIRDIALLKFMVDTGCRSCELLALNIEDIDFEKDSVLIIHGKGDKSRTTYFGKNTEEALKNYLSTREYKTKDPLFLNEENNRFKFQGLRHRIETLCKRAGVEYKGLHAFRRTFGITLYRNGVDIFTISRLLGHSQIEVTKRYLAINNDDLRAVFCNSPADGL